MKDDRLGSDALLLLAAMIWGFAFVAQRVGMRHVGPFTFNAVRFALGSLALLPLAVRLHGRKNGLKAPPPASGPAVPGIAGGDGAVAASAGFGRTALAGGAAAGAVIFFGASFQQVGVVYTTAGKAGFITGLYVILVPILGLLVGRRTGAGTWLGSVMAAAGLYLLSFDGPLSIAKGDALVLAGTVFWAVHVLMIGSLTRRIEPVILAMIQFAACSMLSFAAALLTETMALSSIIDAAVPILYGGLISVGIAYTLQVVAQRHSPPSHAAVLLSLETVFAVIGGWILLGETIPAPGLIGCLLMFGGIVASQVSALRARGLLSRGR